MLSAEKRGYKFLSLVLLTNDKPTAAVTNIIPLSRSCHREHGTFEYERFKDGEQRPFPPYPIDELVHQPEWLALEKRDWLCSGTAGAHTLAIACMHPPDEWKQLFNKQHFLIGWQRP